ncbi:Xanthine phosphoribosyltransferase 1 [Mortierella sp. AD010]|nr:Xanthine phosphoribosyltransferase 1 [Mortierella sp. AD010]
MFLHTWTRIFHRHRQGIVAFSVIFCVLANLALFFAFLIRSSNPTSVTKSVERRQVIVPEVLRSGRQNPVNTPPDWMSDWIAHRKLDAESIGKLNVTMDLVYTWVNGSDPELREMKDFYKERSPLFQALKNHTTRLTKSSTKEVNKTDIDPSVHRFRDNDELRYSVRSTAQYGAPGLFRRTYILATEVVNMTTGKRRQLAPQWLDQEKSRGIVDVIPHSEIYDNKDHLPSFNSLSIESQMHHTPGLADIFVYLNDDVFFGKPINVAEFWTPLYGFVFHLSPSRMILPVVPTKEVITGNVGDEESLQYTNAILAKQFGARRRVYVSHIPHILSVPIMEEIQTLWPEEFNKTSSHRFRGEGYGQEVQAAFFFAHYVMERLRETQLTSYWKYRLDKNQDGKLDWEERQQLIRMVDRFEEVKKENSKVLPQFRNKTRTYLENHDQLLSSVGIPWTGETTYTFSGMDEYPYMVPITIPRRNSRNSRNQYYKKPDPSTIEPSTITCRFDINLCLGPQFTNSSNQAVGGSTGKGSIFEWMAFTKFDCGDCLLHIIRRATSSPGLSEIMPPDKDSEAYKRVLADLAKYNYVVGESQYSFLMLMEGLQSEKALNELMLQRDNKTFFCINDDVKDNRLIEQRSFTKRMPAIVFASVRGLPQPEDNFARKFRNRAPLVIRQIVSPKVLKQWSTDPTHIAGALNQSVQGQEQEQGQELPQLLRHQQDQYGSLETNKEPLLPVMIAEDTRNFMDNPRFTKKITMTASEVVERVLVPHHNLSNAGSEFREALGTEMVSTDTIVPHASIKETSNCPLCEIQAKERASSNENDLGRFYYRGMVPSSLYSDLRIPDLLNSLSLPLESTPFASAPNKDLMRIWISSAGATTPLHYDRCHGVLIQLVGRKRFVVFSYEDISSLYPYDGITGPGHASKVRGLGHCFPFPGSSAGKEDQHIKENMAEVLERWPKVKNADPWVIDLEPGDALYTPPGFWHEVTSVDSSVSVTVAWDMDASELENIPRHMAF